MEFRPRYLYLLFSFLFSLLFHSCGAPGEDDNPDKPYDGEMTILVDKTYETVMRAQVEVFMAQYPKAKINIISESEVQCMKDFMDKKGKFMILNRNINQNEIGYAESLKIFPESGDLAKDGLALICSKNAPKKNYKVEEVKQILSAKDSSDYRLIFESSNSGIVSYVRDSILRGDSINPNSFAAGSAESVIDYVSQSPQSIGLMSMYTILQNDKIVKSYLNKVDVIGVKTDSSDYYWQPYPLYIASRDYPYSLSLYFILNESYQGLAHSFASFLSKEKGQLLFSKYDLFPLHYDIVYRKVDITHDSPFQ